MAGSLLPLGLGVALREHVDAANGDRDDARDHEDAQHEVLEGLEEERDPRLKGRVAHGVAPEGGRALGDRARRDAARGVRPERAHDAVGAAEGLERGRGLVLLAGHVQLAELRRREAVRGRRLGGRGGGGSHG